MKSGLKFLAYFFLAWASLALWVTVSSSIAGCVYGVCFPAGGITVVLGAIAFFFDRLSKKYN